MGSSFPIIVRRHCIRYLLHLRVPATVLRALHAFLLVAFAQRDSVEMTVRSLWLPVPKTATPMESVRLVSAIATRGLREPHAWLLFSNAQATALGTVSVEVLVYALASLGSQEMTAPYQLQTALTTARDTVDVQTVSATAPLAIPEMLAMLLRVGALVTVQLTASVCRTGSAYVSLAITVTTAALLLHLRIVLATVPVTGHARMVHVVATWAFLVLTVPVLRTLASTTALVTAYARVLFLLQRSPPSPATARSVSLVTTAQ